MRDAREPLQAQSPRTAEAADAAAWPSSWQSLLGELRNPEPLQRLASLTLLVEGWDGARVASELASSVSLRTAVLRALCDAAGGLCTLDLERPMALLTLSLALEALDARMLGDWLPRAHSICRRALEAALADPAAPGPPEERVYAVAAFAASLRVSKRPDAAEALRFALPLFQRALGERRCPVGVKAQVLLTLATSVRVSEANRQLLLPVLYPLLSALHAESAGDPLLMDSMSRFVSVWFPRPSDDLLLAFHQPETLSGYGRLRLAFLMSRRGGAVAHAHYDQTSCVLSTAFATAVRERAKTARIANLAAVLPELGDLVFLAAQRSLQFDVKHLSKTLTLVNRSTTATHVFVLQAAPQSYFRVTPGLGFIKPNEHLQIAVSFVPSLADRSGARVSGYLALRSAAGFPLARFALRALSGPALTLLTPAVDFGFAAVGGQQQRRVYVRNVSSVAVNVSFMRVSQQQAAHPESSKAGSEPPPASRDSLRVAPQHLFMRPGETRAVDLTYAPTSDGAALRETLLVLGPGDEQHPVQLTGRCGQPVTVTAAGGELAFGFVVDRVRAPTQHITVTNQDTQRAATVSFVHNSAYLRVPDVVVPPGSTIKAIAQLDLGDDPTSLARPARPLEGPFATQLTVVAPGMASQTLGVSAHVGPVVRVRSLASGDEVHFAPAGPLQPRHCVLMLDNVSHSHCELLVGGLSEAPFFCHADTATHLSDGASADPVTLAALLALQAKSRSIKLAPRKSARLHLWFCSAAPGIFAAQLQLHLVFPFTADYGPLSLKAACVGDWATQQPRYAQLLESSLARLRGFTPEWLSLPPCPQSVPRADAAGALSLPLALTATVDPALSSEALTVTATSEWLYGRRNRVATVTVTNLSATQTAYEVVLSAGFTTPGPTQGRLAPRRSLKLDVKFAPAEHGPDTAAGFVAVVDRSRGQVASAPLRGLCGELCALEAPIEGIVLSVPAPGEPVTASFSVVNHSALALSFAVHLGDGPLAALSDGKTSCSPFVLVGSQEPLRPFERRQMGLQFVTQVQGSFSQTLLLVYADPAAPLQLLEAGSCTANASAGTAQWNVQPQWIDFGDCPLGESRAASLSVSNAHFEDVSLLTHATAPFEVAREETAVAAVGPPALVEARDGAGSIADHLCALLSSQLGRRVVRSNGSAPLQLLFKPRAPPASSQPRAAHARGVSLGTPSLATSSSSAAATAIAGSASSAHVEAAIAVSGTLTLLHPSRTVLVDLLGRAGRYRVSCDAGVALQESRDAVINLGTVASNAAAKRKLRFTNTGSLGVHIAAITLVPTLSAASAGLASSAPASPVAGLAMLPPPMMRAPTISSPSPRSKRIDEAGMSWSLLQTPASVTARQGASGEGEAEGAPLAEEEFEQLEKGADRRVVDWDELDFLARERAAATALAAAGAAAAATAAPELLVATGLEPPSPQQPLTLEPGESVALEVRFDRQEAGQCDALLSLHAVDPAQRGTPQARFDFRLKTSFQPVLKPHLREVNFGVVRSLSSKRVALRFTNEGREPAPWQFVLKSASTVALDEARTQLWQLVASEAAPVFRDGARPPLFSVSSASGLLAAGATETVNIIFSPVAPHAQSTCQLALVTGSIGMEAVTCEGVCGAARLEMAPDEVEFGCVQVGVTKAAIVTLRNTGETPARFRVVNDSRRFAITPSEGLVRAHSYLPLTVRFEAVSGMRYSGVCTVQWTSHAEAAAPRFESALRLRLGGSGGEPELVVKATMLDFGVVTLNSRSTLMLRIYNNGAAEGLARLHCPAADISFDVDDANVEPLGDELRSEAPSRSAVADDGESMRGATEESSASSRALTRSRGGKGPSAVVSVFVPRLAHLDVPVVLKPSTLRPLSTFCHVLSADNRAERYEVRILAKVGLPSLVVTPEDALHALDFGACLPGRPNKKDFVIANAGDVASRFEFRLFGPCAPGAESAAAGQSVKRAVLAAQRDGADGPTRFSTLQDDGGPPVYAGREVMVTPTSGVLQPGQSERIVVNFVAQEATPSIAVVLLLAVDRLEPRVGEVRGEAGRRVFHLDMVSRALDFGLCRLRRSVSKSVGVVNAGNLPLEFDVGPEMTEPQFRVYNGNVQAARASWLAALTEQGWSVDHKGKCGPREHSPVVFSFRPRREGPAAVKLRIVSGGRFETLELRGAGGRARLRLESAAGEVLAEEAEEAEEEKEAAEAKAEGSEGEGEGEGGKKQNEESKEEQAVGDAQSGHDDASSDASDDAAAAAVDFGLCAVGRPVVQTLTLANGGSLATPFIVSRRVPPEFSVHPMQGLVPAGGAVPLLVTFRPSLTRRTAFALRVVTPSQAPEDATVSDGSARREAWSEGKRPAERKLPNARPLVVRVRGEGAAGRLGLTFFSSSDQQLHGVDFETVAVGSVVERCFAVLNSGSAELPLRVEVTAGGATLRAIEATLRMSGFAEDARERADILRTVTRQGLHSTRIQRLVDLDGDGRDDLQQQAQGSSSSSSAPAAARPQVSSRVASTSLEMTLPPMHWRAICVRLVVDEEKSYAGALAVMAGDFSAAEARGEALTLPVRAHGGLVRLAHTGSLDFGSTVRGHRVTRKLTLINNGTISTTVRLYWLLHSRKPPSASASPSAASAAAKATAAQATPSRGAAERSVVVLDNSTGLRQQVRAAWRSAISLVCDMVRHYRRGFKTSSKDRVSLALRAAKVADRARADKLRVQREAERVSDDEDDAIDTAAAGGAAGAAGDAENSLDVAGVGATGEARSLHLSEGNPLQGAFRQLRRAGRAAERQIRELASRLPGLDGQSAALEAPGEGVQLSTLLDYCRRTNFAVKLPRSVDFLQRLGEESQGNGASTSAPTVHTLRVTPATFPLARGGGQREIKVELTLPEVGPFTAVLVVDSQLPGVRPYEVVLTARASSVLFALEDPSPLDFGHVALGDTEILQRTVVNRGDIKLSFTVHHSNPYLSVLPLRGSIEPRKSQQITFAFRAIDEGVFHAPLQLISNVGPPIVLQVEAAAGVPKLSVEGGRHLDFGRCMLNQPSRRVAVLGNVGNATLRVQRIEMERSPVFAPGAEWPEGAVALRPGTRLQLPVFFTPSSAHTFHGAISLRIKDETVTIALHGAGREALLMLDKEKLQFSRCVVKSTYERHIAVTNLGEVEFPLTLSVRAATEDDWRKLAATLAPHERAELRLRPQQGGGGEGGGGGGNGEPSPQELSESLSREIEVTPSNCVLGPFEKRTFSVHYRATTQRPLTACRLVLESVYSLSVVPVLAACGLASLDVQPRSIDFGACERGTTQATALRLCNTGSVALAYAVKVTSQRPHDALPFSLTRWEGVVNAHSVAEIMCTLDSSRLGECQDELCIETERAGLRFFVPVKGSCSAAEIRPEEFNLVQFGACLVGEPATRDVNIANHGGFPLTFALRSHFPVRVEPESGTVAPRTTTALRLSWTPTGSYELRSAIRCMTNCGAVEIRVRGVGHYPRFHLQPSVIDLGDCAVGVTASRVFSVVNSGAVPVRWSVSGTDGGELEVAPASGLLERNQTSRVELRFTPRAASGPRAMRLVVSAPPRLHELTVTAVPYAANLEMPSQVDLGAIPSGLHTVAVEVRNAGSSRLAATLSVTAPDRRTEMATCFVEPRALQLAPGERKRVLVTLLSDAGDAKGQIDADCTAPPLCAMLVARSGGRVWTANLQWKPQRAALGDACRALLEGETSELRSLLRAPEHHGGSSGERDALVGEIVKPQDSHALLTLWGKHGVVSHLLAPKEPDAAGADADSDLAPMLALLRGTRPASEQRAQ